VDPEGDAGRRQVDASHRGGKAGFVRIDGDVLTIPDFAGNLHFNTLGNLQVNPRAGLLFIDFANGDLLQLTGRTELLLAGDEVSSFQGAERLWRLQVDKVVRRHRVLKLRWRPRGNLAQFA
jgi:predicted pyridoxine 5'-phosphate oxidase superfamily flavin-nucleotide-binding protein